MSTRPGFPALIGFDLPGPQAGTAPQRVIVTALLDDTPRNDWMRMLHRLAWPLLRVDHGVEQIRLVGEGIHFVGAIADARALSAAVRGLFNEVNAKVLNRRLAALDNPLDDDGPGMAPAASLAHSTDPRLDDVAALMAMPAVPGMLELASAMTGMRFVAVARVTADRWTACAVHDRLDFGLRPGDDLVLETTICDEIREHRHLVQFDQASTHPVFSSHPTPALYGFESYISVPMFRRDGGFHGTLCALDPNPSRLDGATVKAFEVLAGVIGAHLDVPEAQGEAGQAVVSMAEALSLLSRQVDALDAATLPAQFRAVTARLRELVDGRGAALS
ncbi:GAF domain-containing protein [Stenotrophomonas rhizophila]|uniref:GAF domain-containing protein n=1 Tax=Stenotrophomonas rhizophila TaxID=216778 RepID=UPI001D00E888|nr:GAF domain-containing protein [Stenotrophomonas rhizophila]